MHASPCLSSPGSTVISDRSSPRRGRRPGEIARDARVVPRAPLSHRPGFIRHHDDEARRRDVTVDEGDELTRRFEEHRSHLRAVAYRMLGSLGEADDAVQEAWLRLSRSDTSGIENLGGWLTTVVARVCLNMLQSRRSRREEPLEFHEPRAGGGGP